MITEEKTDRMLLCKYYYLCLPGSAKLVIIREEQTDRMLLCNYNFLCLPGSAKLVMIRKEKTDRKLRLFLQLQKAVFSGEKRGSFLA